MEPLDEAGVGVRRGEARDAGVRSLYSVPWGIKNPRRFLIQGETVLDGGKMGSRRVGLKAQCQQLRLALISWAVSALRVVVSVESTFP